MLALGLPLESPPADPDAALVRECQSGRPEAFSELVSRHRDGIHSFVRHVVGHAADAEDLSQEAFVRAFAALPRFRAGAPFEPWIYTIAANLCRSHLRRRRWKWLSLDEPALGETLPAADADPAAAAERNDDRQRLRCCIAALPLEQRMVVVLRHLRGYTYAEIARVVGLPVSTVEHRLRAARRTLQAQLVDEVPAGGRAR